MEANSRRLMGLEKKKKVEEEWNNIYNSKHQLSSADFPSYFVFGVATSAYQVLFYAFILFRVYMNSMRYCLT